MQYDRNISSEYIKMWFKVLITNFIHSKTCQRLGKIVLYILNMPGKLLVKAWKKSWKTLDFLNYEGVRTLPFTTQRLLSSVFIRGDLMLQRWSLSPLMKTLDGNVKTLGRECNSIGHCIHLNITRGACAIYFFKTSFLKLLCLHLCYKWYRITSVLYFHLQSMFWCLGCHHG